MIDTEDEKPTHKMINKKQQQWVNEWMNEKVKNRDANDIK